MSELTRTIFEEVFTERMRQDDKWGVQNHASPLYLTILVEEVGEVARAILEHRQDQVRAELIQVAAVAVAFVESIDRSRKNADPVEAVKQAIAKADLIAENAARDIENSWFKPNG